ncbi:hypothetical protein PCANB_002371 [Pneumocystis canis]|nr:hypothetical protein PCK1_002319 [Pneumocystis canis]KAG5439039.1 hypothetical protein PCANB_002371 [Pneumocystis canis]
MSFGVKKKNKKIFGFKSDDNSDKFSKKCHKKTDNQIKKSETHRLVMSESSSVYSYETEKKLSFFDRIYPKKKTGKPSGSKKLTENFENVSTSKINVNTSTFYYPPSTLSLSPHIYSDIQHTSPSSSIFDKSHVFERSVDYSSLTFSSPSTSISITPSVYKMRSADSIHQRRIVDNYIPTVLDASMEILNDSTNMNNIEIVSVKRLYSPAFSSEAFEPKDSLTSFTSLYTKEASLSFVSYADLVNMDHCETSSSILTVMNGSEEMESNCSLYNTDSISSDNLIY